MIDIKKMCLLKTNKTYFLGMWGKDYLRCCNFSGRQKSFQTCFQLDFADTEWSKCSRSYSVAGVKEKSCHNGNMDFKPPRINRFNISSLVDFFCHLSMREWLFLMENKMKLNPHTFMYKLWQNARCKKKNKYKFIANQYT